MNSIVKQFQTKAELESKANLAEFIPFCRDDLTWTNNDSDFDWESARWRGTRWLKVEFRVKRVFDQSAQLDGEFIDFAKAHYRYMNSYSPGKTKDHQVSALAVLETALLNITKSGSIEGLSLQVLDEAAAVTRLHYGIKSQYKIGRILMELGTFVCKRKLVASDISSWKSPFTVQPSSQRRTGLVGRQKIDAKMPSQASLEALADIFASDPPEPEIRFASAVWALLMSAPMRISELFNFHVDAEYEELNDEGVLCYGFRYYGAKGFQHDIKWVPEIMVPVAREAFRRIKDMTDSARNLAAHLESAPDVPFRYPDCPKVEDHDQLSLRDKASYLRRPEPNSPISSLPLWQFSSIAEHWGSCRRRIPKDFPHLNVETKLPWSKALFCMHVSMLKAGFATNYYRLWVPRTHTVIVLLGGNPDRKERSVFDRLGHTEPDGRRIKLTTHQARHYLSTLAERGGMAQEDLARWAGRANPRGNRAYIHMTVEERVAQARTFTQDIQFFGAHELPQTQEPVTVNDLNLCERGPVHKTEFGFCTHLFVMSPCDKYRDCMNCLEHVYVKGDTDCLSRIKGHEEFLQSQYDTAREGIERGEFGADRWYEYLEKTLFPAKQLRALLESDEIKDGTLIKRNPRRCAGTQSPEPRPGPKASAFDSRFTCPAFSGVARRKQKW